MWKYLKKYIHFAIFASLFMILEVLMDLVQPRLLEKITGQNVGNDMRKDCFRNVLTFSQAEVDRFRAGSLITRVTNDVTQVERYISQFIRGLVRTVMLTFGSIVFMFLLNRTFGIVVTCVLPFMVGCIVLCLWKANPLFLRLQERLDILNNLLQEEISGIRIIKACVREGYEKLRFGKANDELIRIQMQILVLFAFMNPVYHGTPFAKDWQLYFRIVCCYVDTRTEKDIQDAMQQIMQDRTSIVIAHRLSTIRDSDLIVVMEQGRIAEEGTHEELLAKKGKYYELYMAQYAGIAI